jgi:lysozyme
MENLKDYIKKNEGLRLKPYRCKAKKLTIGWGRNLTDRGISQAEAEVLFEHDLTNAVADLMKVFKFRELNFLLADQQTALIDMMFNLGLTKFRKFKKMIQAVKDKNFKEAGRQIMDSKYAREDVPKRAARNKKLMKSRL